jgi:hypothetical protein
MSMTTNSRRVGGALIGSFVAVLLLSYVAVASGAPFLGTLDAVGGVHFEAEYIEGTAVETVPVFDGPDGCNDSLRLSFEEATVSGASLYATLPEPVSDGSTEVGLELAADEYDMGSVQILVSEMEAEYDADNMSLSAKGGDESGFSLSADEFRFENVTTRIYGFGSGWFDAPFVRTGYEPNAETVEKYRC